MPQSLSKVIVHVVFSTKGREPWLRDVEVRKELHAYMAVVLRDVVDSPALVIGGVEDHVHALVTLSRKHAVMEVVRVMKTETSKWLKGKAPELSGFAWQAGYGAFSVSESGVADVRKYIEGQEERHRRLTFKDEFRAFCKRYRVEIDERYVWD